MENMNGRELIKQKMIERRTRLEQDITVEKEYTNEDLAMIMQRLAKYDLLLVMEYLPKLCHVEFIGPEVINYGNNQEVMNQCFEYHQNQHKQLNKWLTKLEAELLLIEETNHEKQIVLPDYLSLETKERENVGTYLEVQNQLTDLIAEVAEGNGYVSAPTVEEFVNKYQTKVTEAEKEIRKKLENPMFSHGAEYQMTFFTNEEERYQQKYYQDYLLNSYSQANSQANPFDLANQEQYNYQEEKRL